ncbi:MAG: hypothetical protein QE263_03985 [Vampirovibrionales bacterium]|nr:hypothetical protein [Vampirovibrionales bacterium]
MRWAFKAILLIIPVLLLTTLVVPSGWTDTESLRLDTKVDPTAVSNMDDRSMRVAAEMQYPGLHEWQRWRVKALHPDTGEVVTCRYHGPDDCRHFENYAHYTTFRIGQWQAAERTKFRWFRR